VLVGIDQRAATHGSTPFKLVIQTTLSGEDDS